MKPENFRLKLGIKIRRNWNGVKIYSSEKLDENTMIINLITDMNYWNNFESFKSAMKISLETVTKNRQVITKIHKKGFNINENTKEEKTILPIIFINQEEE